jgi:hypothetical protein
MKMLVQWVLLIFTVLIVFSCHFNSHKMTNAKKVSSLSVDVAGSDKYQDTETDSLLTLTQWRKSGKDEWLH